MAGGHWPNEEVEPAKRRERRPRILRGGLFVFVLVLGIVVALGAAGLTVAGVFGLGWLAYAGLALPAIAIQNTIVDLEFGPRLLMFGVWLGLTTVLAVILVSVVGQWIRSDSVVAVLSVSTICVLFAFSVTSWIVYFLALTFFP